MKKILLLSICAVLALYTNAQKLPFQGKLIESGSPVNGTRTFTFVMDTTWTETHTNVSVTDGLYFVVLGSINPLPANLFYTSDERQLAISVDGTDLGPVTLYRPLDGGQDGLDLKGRTTGFLKGGFYAGTPELENLPYLFMNGNTEYAYNVMMAVGRTSTGIEKGILQLSSTDNQASRITSNELWLKNNNVYNAQLISQNWDSLGYAGTLLLRGPSNQLNFEIGNKHWENADLPWLNMVGTTGNSVISMSGEKYDDNGTDVEAGQIVVVNSNELKSLISPLEFAITKPDYTMLASLQNGGDNGRLLLRGPNTQNFWMGGQSWIEGKGADRPLFSMTGSADQPVFSLECSNDDTNEEAIVHLYSQIGNQANLYPTLFEMKDANRTYSTFRKSDWGNGSFGMIELAGPNSSNFEFSSFGGNPDRGYMALRGANGNNMVEIFANEYNGSEYGQIVTSNVDEVRSVVTPTEILLTKADWTMLASLRNAGESGQLELRGPTTQNILMGSTDDTNRAYFVMKGNTETDRVLNIVENDDRGIEVGRSYTYSADEKISRTEPTNITLFDGEGGNWKSLASMSFITDNNGERGILTLSNKDNDNDWTTYANNGTWGSGPFNMWSGAMVNGELRVSGVLTLNGDTLTSGSSDRRFKKEIQVLGNNVLSQISNLNGYSYFFRTDEFPQKHFSEAQQIGLIAQELEEQFPALVRNNNDGYKSVNYDGFTAVLLEAVKELNAKVDKLESDNNRLQAQLSASTEKSDEMAALKKQVDLLTKLVQENMAGSSESEKTAAKN